MRLITYVNVHVIYWHIIELFIDDNQYVSLCCARYILLSIPSVQIR